MEKESEKRDGVGLIPVLDWLYHIWKYLLRT
jgi:hypothetical protein